MSTEDLNTAVERALAGGIAVTIHAIGDAANRRVLDAIELAQMAGAPLPALPNRIEHCQLVHPNDIPRFAQLGVIASMQPIHATADMDMADRLWGERCATAYAWHAFQEAGATLAFGSDAPVEPLNPWLSVHAAVTRQRLGGMPPEAWYPEQRIELTEALRGFTVGPAIAAGASHEQGILAPGMLADLAVLSADPFKIHPSDLHAVNAELTMIEGEVVWTRP